MTNKTAAMRYARALLDVAIKEQADLDQIERDLGSVAALFTQYPELAHALLNPVVLFRANVRPWPKLAGGIAS